MAQEQLSFFQSTFDRRFLEDYVGKSILNDPKVALIELIANSWDAYSSEVKVSWPSKENRYFSIEDNGCGLTEEEFYQRWMKLSYNRTNEQGIWAEIPARLKKQQPKKRRTFGQNGKGRHSAFCFSEDGYYVETSKNGKKIVFHVFIPSDKNTPIGCSKISEKSCKKDISGTKVYVTNTRDLKLSADEMMKEVGMRFLGDPDFQVWVDKLQITFSNIPENNVAFYNVDIDGNNKVEIIRIDTEDTDRTTRQHGIAWQVHGRLVGDIDWNSLGDKSFIDGRKAAAKRFSFIVKADSLLSFVEADWSGFKKFEKQAQSTVNKINDKIKEILFETTEEQQKEIFTSIVQKNNIYIKEMASQERSAWALSIREIQKQCPSLSENDIESVAAILAKMEAAKSKYGLLSKLRDCSIDDIDALDKILETWTVETAKTVLDELETRLKLIDELSRKVDDNNTDEVKELQPLFEKGLWIFGPEFEAVGFTANKGMSTVIQERFHKKVKGSRKRPDIVVTIDSSIGFYSYPEFEQSSGEEVGTGRLVIIELKAPDVPLGQDETNQCFKYVTELLDKGMITDSTKVDCYLLGRKIMRHFSKPINHGDNVIIRPFPFELILTKAKNRTHRLYDKIKHTAPFLNEKDPLMDENTVQGQLAI